MTADPADIIQEHLLTFCEKGEPRALARAFAALRDELVGPVARFLRAAPGSSTVEQTLSDLLVDLLSVRDGAPPRALAPVHHPKPAAFRRTVVLNALRDRLRRDNAYQRVLAAHAVEPSTVETPTLEELLELRDMRDKVVALLPKLDIRRRTALSLELGVKLPLSWAGELANELGLSMDEVMERLRAYEAAPFSEEAKLGVIYGPQGQMGHGRDAYRQTVRRASAELGAWVRRGRS